MYECSNGLIIYSNVVWSLPLINVVCELWVERVKDIWGMQCLKERKWFDLFIYYYITAFGVYILQVQSADSLLCLFVLRDFWFIYRPTRCGQEDWIMKDLPMWIRYYVLLAFEMSQLQYPIVDRSFHKTDLASKVSSVSTINAGIHTFKHRRWGICKLLTLSNLSFHSVSFTLVHIIHT